MEVKRNVYYEVFDTSDDNTLIESFSTLESAIEVAKKDENFAIDLVVDIEDEDSENLLSSGENFYSVKVYPSLEVYTNYKEVTEIEV